MINTRQCDFPSCTRPTWEPRRSLCRRHDSARERRGHPAVTHSLSWRTLEPAHAVVLAYLKLHPAPPDVLQKLEQHILGPSADFAYRQPSGLDAEAPDAQPLQAQKPHGSLA